MFLKRLIQNANILLVIEDISTVCMKEAWKKQTLKRIQCFTISKGTFHCKKIQRTSIRLTSMFIKVWESSLHPEKNRKELISKRFSNSKELLCYNFWLIEVANPLFFTRLFLNSSGEQRLPYKHLFLLPLTFFILSNYCSSYSFLHDEKKSNLMCE